MRKSIFLITIIVLVAAIAYSGYRLELIVSDSAKESEIHSQLLRYKPTPPPETPSGVPDAAPPELNQQIVDLQAEYPDVAGWLTIPNTAIDYPFTQAGDNSYYLRRDLSGQPLTAGTVFMDYRNRKDFSDFNTVLYGHNMNDGSMFGALKYFNDQSFFDSHTTGALFLADKTYTIEFFAFAVIEPNDAEIYDPAVSGDAGKAAFLDYVKNAARYYRDIGVTGNDHLVTLSTCNYEFNNARMVLIGRLINAPPAKQQ